jgi:hypothetical protein
LLALYWSVWEEQEGVRGLLSDCYLPLRLARFGVLVEALAKGEELVDALWRGDGVRWGGHENGRWESSESEEKEGDEREEGRERGEKRLSSSIFEHWSRSWAVGNDGSTITKHCYENPTPPSLFLLVFLTAAVLIQHSIDPLNRQVIQWRYEVFLSQHRVREKRVRT